MNYGNYNYNYNYSPGGQPDAGQPSMGTAQLYSLRQKERKQIKRLGLAAGLGVLIFIVIQNLESALLMFTGLVEPYRTNADFSYAVGILFSVFAVVPAFLAAFFCLKKEDRAVCLSFGRPYDIKLMLFAVPVGLMVCMAANFGTDFLQAFFRVVGINFSSPPSETPTSPLGIIAFVINIAIVPALVEEFAIRGVLMMPLRRYGNTFAVVASSAVFGLMHGSFIQGLFAFCIGIFLGYLVICTGSIWTGTLVHCLNNLFACIISLLYNYMSSRQVALMYYLISFAIIIVGLAFVPLMLHRAGKCGLAMRFKKSGTYLSGGKKFSAYILNVPMVLCIIYLVYTACRYVSFSLFG